MFEANVFFSQGGIKAYLCSIIIIRYKHIYLLLLDIFQILFLKEMF